MTWVIYRANILKKAYTSADRGIVLPQIPDIMPYRRLLLLPLLSATFHPTCIILYPRILQAPSEERKINHYWSPSGPVVVSNSDQYYFASWPVLLRSMTSTGWFFLFRGGQFAPAEEVRRRGEIGGADVTDFMVYSYCLRRGIWWIQNISLNL